MKHYLTPHDYLNISEPKKKKLKTLWQKEVGNHVFCKLNFQEKELKKYNGTYVGVITSVKENSYSAIWDLNGQKTGVFPYINASEDVPLFSFSQLVEMLQTAHVLIEKYDVDCMWEQVKNELLNNN